MTQPPPGDGKLFVEALDLCIHLQNDPANPIVRELVQRWRALDPAREAVWAEVVEIHGMAGKVITDRHRAIRARAATTRRNVMLGAAGLVAAGLGAALGPRAVTRLRADQVTATGEIRDVQLADGTMAMLGPDSAMRSDFTADRRRVELLSGMAYFAVTKDADRPFQGIVGDLSATVLGTAFEIGGDAGYLTVAVERGEIEIAIPRVTAERLGAGAWLAWDSETGRIARGERNPGQVAAWRSGIIIADGEPLSSVIARIYRWQTGRVVIAEPDFGARPVSGVFDVRNPILALEAVLQPHGGKLHRISPWLSVVSTI